MSAVNISIEEQLKKMIKDLCYHLEFRLHMEEKYEEKEDYKARQTVKKAWELVNG